LPSGGHFPASLRPGLEPGQNRTRPEKGVAAFPKEGNHREINYLTRTIALVLVQLPATIL
jgi:hypothetical protein